MTTIEFDYSNNDYLLDNKPLLYHLEKHEKINPEDYIPALLTQPLASKRLHNVEKSDLVDNHVAIYLCSHCGGYDGNPIGVKVLIEANTVSWLEIGIYSDDDNDSFSEPFNKVSGYTFSKENYFEFISNIKVYEQK